MLVAEKRKKEEPTIEQVIRDAQERKLFDRLQARARLLELAEVAKSARRLPQEEQDVQRVRQYLFEWRAHVESFRMRLGFPSTCSWASKCTEEIRTATEWLERSDKWAMDQVDQAVMEDLLRHEDGEAMRAAILNRLLNHAMPARVLRSGRLIGVAIGEVDALADRAERVLVDILKTRHLPFA